MAVVEGRAVADVSQSAAWSYLLDYENWIRELNGYIDHDVDDDGTIVLTLRGKVAYMTKKSRLRLTITSQHSPKVAFLLEGLDDPVEGEGELLCEADVAGGTLISYRLALGGRGTAAPLINEFLERAVPTTIGDLSAKVADRLSGRSRQLQPSKAVIAAPRRSIPARVARRVWTFLSKASSRVESLDVDETYDVVVIGSGGAGLTAAIVAHDLGARVVVLEKSQRVGGTFAYSTGLVWVPNNHHMQDEGVLDSRDEALAYIRSRTNGRHDERVLQAFIDNAPRVIAHLEKQLGVPFEIVPHYPDEQSAEPGGRAHGRYLASPLFNATEVLGEEWAAKIVTSPNFGALPMSWVEIQQAGGFGSIAKWDWPLLAKRAQADYRGFGMSTAGFLLAAALKRRIPIMTGVAGQSLVLGDRRVEGVRTQSEQGARVLRATKGVVLATGSYDNNEEMKRNLEPYPTNSVTLGAETVDGSGLVMAMEIGAKFAVFGGQLLIPAIHIPGEEYDGKPAHRMLARESGFPGSMIVNRAGRRFCDEATITELRRALAVLDPHTRTYPNLPAFFIFDQSWKDRYPLGSVMPGDTPVWITRGVTLEELAAKLGLDASSFVATVQRFNENANAGRDPDFGRGSTAYSRAHGDPDVTPNPCLRALQPPFYAIELKLGIVGTNGGLLINDHGQVIHLRGHPLRGLYAVGNTAANQIGGLWYNGGLMNARGMTFGYLAAHHAMGRSVAS